MDNEPFDLTVEIRDVENIGVRTGGAGSGSTALAGRNRQSWIVEAKATRCSHS